MNLKGMTDLTRQDVFDAHAQFGQLDRRMVKAAMGKNWPKEWDDLCLDGSGIFSPDLLKDAPK
jgi:hypothetical protein